MKDEIDWSCRLRDAARNVRQSGLTLPNAKAQSGEDYVLSKCFAGKPAGVYVEVGAYDGIEISNTYLFETLGWSGVLIEADPEIAQRCRENRPNSTVVNCAVVRPEHQGTATFNIVEACRSLSTMSLDSKSVLGYLGLVRRNEGELKVRKVAVPARTLDSVLQEVGARGIDFMTIDVEGHELDVLLGFSPSIYKIPILIVESNTILPEAKIMPYLHRAGYRYAMTTGVNNWFYLAGPRSVCSPVYRLWLAAYFYAPRYYKILRDWLRGAAKWLLARAGALEIARRIVRGKGSAPEK
jgi:FkbM family methyltransferase